MVNVDTCEYPSTRPLRDVLLLLLLLFLIFSVLVANPEKLLYTVANPARGLLNREKKRKEKVWRRTSRWIFASVHVYHALHGYDAIKSTNHLFHLLYRFGIRTESSSQKR